MNRRGGFSLVELMIVVAIIGVMSSVLYPNFSRMQTKSKEAALKTTVHSIQMAIETFYMTTGSYPTGTHISGSQLAQILQQAGELGTLPKNPFTGKSFSDSDSSGKLVYRYDATTEVYTLEYYGKGNKNKLGEIQNL